MGMAAGPASLMDRAQPVDERVQGDAAAKDAIISWFRAEFAAANAIIDALCGHLAQLHGGGGQGSEYGAVFAAIHGRRLNWIPVLQMQKYQSIAEVTAELRKVAAQKMGGGGADEKKRDESDDVKSGSLDDQKEKIAEKVIENVGNGEIVGSEEDDSPDSEITDSGSQEVHHTGETIELCSNHDECDGRPSQFKLTKGFSAKEHVRGHMVNVVKGLKLYEDIFTESELAKLSDLVNELRAAGHNGELSDDTFILFNKQMKGNKRELIQFGIPIFGHIKEEHEGNNRTIDIEPIPALLQHVVDHLIQWKLIPEYKKPNGCVINFFDEGEYSQPFLKPPHLDQPICTLLLSDSTMAFGRTLTSDNEGNYRGALTFSLKEGSLLVIRGNSADMARHVMCPSPIKRVSITFFRVRPDSNQGQLPPTSPQAAAMTLWQPGMPGPYAVPNGPLNGYDAANMTPKWGVFQAPVVMLAPVSPVVVSPGGLPQCGTGVFLPWTAASKKPAKHLPPRAQKGRLLALPPTVETHASKAAPQPSITIEGQAA
ncbi:hypothetical protein SLA2020_208840 [Shorea laevis]